MRNATDSLLVAHESLENVRRLYLEFRQWPVGLDHFFYPLRSHLIRDTSLLPNPGRGDHSPRYGFAVQQAIVSGLGLKSVSDGVTIIKDATFAAFPLVAANDISFDLNAVADKLLQHFAVAGKQRIAVLLHQLEDTWIANHTILHRFE